MINSPYTNVKHRLCYRAIITENFYDIFLLFEFICFPFAWETQNENSMKTQNKNTIHYFAFFSLYFLSIFKRTFFALLLTD